MSVTLVGASCDVRFVVEDLGRTIKAGPVRLNGSPVDLRAPDARLELLVSGPGGVRTFLMQPAADLGVAQYAVQPGDFTEPGTFAAMLRLIQGRSVSFFGPDLIRVTEIFA